ncbi:MAG: hypothetical protein EOO02_14120 [Chitinophagaceae bacterium]|nr:MAG: hypothetical protein EOO02_14120 [Chitinophagaceae bacterium]
MTQSTAVVPQPARLHLREKYSAIILLIIGVVYLAVWLISIFSETTGFVQVNEKQISMNTAELLNHIRTLLIIIFSIGGGFGLFRLRRFGWILANVIFLLFLTIVSGGIYQALKLADTTLIVIACTGATVLLLAVIFLWLPSARLRLSITRSDMITAAALSVVMTAFYLLAQ